MQECQTRKNWAPRECERPRVCPKCKSAYWDVARKLGKNEMNTTDNKSDNLAPEQQTIEKIKRWLTEEEQNSIEREKSDSHFFATIKIDDKLSFSYKRTKNLQRQNFY